MISEDKAVRTHSFKSHTSEEMRRLSNQGHIMEGALLAAIGILAILNNMGVADWAATVWRLLALLTGIALLIILYPRHPISEWGLIWRDPQQRQHTVIAMVIILAGIAEFVQTNAGVLVLQYVWPVALLIIGILFMTHTQHGRGEAVHQAALRHRALGVTIIIAGLVRLLEIILQSNVLGLLWPIALLIAAVQLVIYREPKGAFDKSVSH